jgi:hypothetical protein
MFETPESNSSTWTPSSSCSSSSSSSMSMTPPVPKKKKLSAFSSMPPTSMPVAAAAPPAPPIRVELVTLTLYATIEDDVPYVIAIAIDKGYRIREGLNNPSQKYPIPLMYWTLANRQRALISFTGMSTPTLLLQGNGIYLANGIVEDLEKLQQNSFLLEEMAKQIRESYHGTIHEGCLIKFKSIKMKCEPPYIHGLIALDAFAKATFKKNVVETNDLVILEEINYE